MWDERMMFRKSDLKVLKRRAEQDELNFTVLIEFMESIRETSVRGLSLLETMKGGYRND